MSHSDLKEAAKKAVKELFGDSSVSQSTTRASLEEVREEIDEYLETLDSDT